MKKYIIIIAIILTCLVSILPMGLSPEWNGKNMYHRNQYELLAESMIKGRVDIEYDKVYYDKLSQLDNPYDTKLRDEKNVTYKWDHAYYKGKYYVYFGVVPVIITFLPFRFLTGHSLNTFHATQIYVAIFIIGIGDKLKSGIEHDLRSPDYDDWKLDGDMLIYDKVLDRAVEITSMGIRVDEKSLLAQLEKMDSLDKIELPYYQKILKKELPYSIGGGIGISRILMFLLEKTHIAEVQASSWETKTLEYIIDKKVL